MSTSNSENSSAQMNNEASESMKMSALLQGVGPVGDTFAFEDADSDDDGPCSNKPQHPPAAFSFLSGMMPVSNPAASIPTPSILDPKICAGSHKKPAPSTNVVDDATMDDPILPVISPAPRTFEETDPIHEDPIEDCDGKSTAKRSCSAANRPSRSESGIEDTTERTVHEENSIDKLRTTLEPEDEIPDSQPLTDTSYQSLPDTEPETQANELPDTEPESQTPLTPPDFQMTAQLEQATELTLQLQSVPQTLTSIEPEVHFSEKAEETNKSHDAPKDTPIDQSSDTPNDNSNVKSNEQSNDNSDSAVDPVAVVTEIINETSVEPLPQTPPSQSMSFIAKDVEINVPDSETDLDQMEIEPIPCDNQKPAKSSVNESNIIVSPEKNGDHEEKDEGATCNPPAICSTSNPVDNIGSDSLQTPEPAQRQSMLTTPEAIDNDDGVHTTAKLMDVDPESFQTPEHMKQVSMHTTPNAESSSSREAKARHLTPSTSQKQPSESQKKAAGTEYDILVAQLDQCTDTLRSSKSDLSDLLARATLATETLAKHSIEFHLHTHDQICHYSEARLRIDRI